MRFHFKQYESEAVIFDAASGDTHYLAPLAVTLYQLCCEFPGLPRNDLKNLLARHQIGAALPHAALFDETLDGLRKIGLIHHE